MVVALQNHRLRQTIEIQASNYKTNNNIYNSANNKQDSNHWKCLSTWCTILKGAVNKDLNPRQQKPVEDSGYRK